VSAANKNQTALPPVQEPEKYEATDEPGAGKAKDIAAGLIGSIYVDSSLSADDQKTKIDAVIDLRSKALGPSAPADGTNPELALTELKAMNRAAEIPSLDNAAKILTGITALVTGLFTGIGFTTGDFIRMIRDFQGQGIAFLVLASLALLLGTFAFVVNAYRSSFNLWVERIAVYTGIACAGASFILASWGLAQGASAGQTRPVISASFTTSSGTPVLNVSVNSSNVPRSEHLTATVWGDGPAGWTVLSSLVTGPAPDGTDNASITVNDVATYTQIQVSAFLSATDVPTTTAPPQNCSAGTSCFVLAGVGTPSATPTPTVTPPGSLSTSGPGRRPAPSSANGGEQRTSR
jgi:hypothetical protein